MKTKSIITLLCVLAALLPAGAQTRFLPPVSESDSSIIVSLLTCAPGRNIYELEGHSGLRLQYAGNDITINWGLFDFDSPGFVYRFVKGETDYSIGACYTDAFVAAYARQGRCVTEQTLNLNQAQAAKVIDLVEENLQPGNRIYRYNYVKDNCATRPLRIIEQAIGDTVIFTTTATQLGKSPTFRSEMQYFHANYPWYQFGIDLALGKGLDRTIATRETIFAPVILQQLISGARIAEADGSTTPLVISTSTLSPGNPQGIADDPTPWHLTPYCAAIALLVLTCIISIPRMRKMRARPFVLTPTLLDRWFDAILFGLFGLAGIIIAFLVFVSVHEASSPNWLILWLNPLCLLVPITQWSAGLRKISTIYHGYNIIVSLALIFIFRAHIQVCNPAIPFIILSGLIRSLVNVRYATKK